jgi:hypothetical protein
MSGNAAARNGIVAKSGPNTLLPEQLVDGLARGEGGVVGDPLRVGVFVGGVQVDVDLEGSVLEDDRHVVVPNVRLLVPGEDQPLRRVGCGLDDLLVGRLLTRHLRAAGAGTARTGRAAHAAARAAEQFLELALEVLELLLDALLLLLEGLEADLEGVDLLFEVVLGRVVVGLDEQLADVTVHRRLLVDVVELVEGALGLLEVRLGLLFLHGDFLCGLLKTLKLFDFLLCFRRQVSLHISTVALRTDKAKLCRSSESERPNPVGRATSTPMPLADVPPMMRRRDLLAAGALSSALSLSAGCLETLGREDAWRELVVDPPDGAYVPPKVDGMLQLGGATVDGLELSLSATRPHSFWTVAGDERARADVRDHHDVHLMATVTDAETGLTVPTSVSTTIRSREGRIDERTLWPMLSQRMGFHYGDNVPLGEDGPHAATVRIEPTSVDASGVLADRLESPRTVDFEFEYAAAEIESLERRLIDEDEGRGEAGAVEPMEHDHGGHESEDNHDDHRSENGHGNHDDHRSENGHGNHDDHRFENDHGDHNDSDADDHESGADLETATDEWLGTARSGDLEFGVGVLENGSGGDAEDTVVVNARTRYNQFSLPFAGLSVAPARNGSLGEKVRLAERLDAELGHYYGAPVERDRLEATAELAVTVDATPQLSRHEGYETAFFDLEPATVSIE